MKTRSSIIAASIGMIILSVFMLVKEPAYGMANIGRFRGLIAAGFYSNAGQ